jgi:hypothetical protein
LVSGGECEQNNFNNTMIYLRWREKMNTLEAMEKRHTVRKYSEQKVSNEILETIKKRINELNNEYGLSMKLITENKDAFGGFVKLFMTKGVRNYLILAGDETNDLEEKSGYCGIDVVLLAQQLGLNSWWVASTYNKEKVKKMIQTSSKGKVSSIIALGYGVSNGRPHKSKNIDEVSKYMGTAPEWFTKGVQAALLAPTAMNKQAFVLKGDGNKVAIICNNGIYSNIDKGIVKYCFETGAGKEKFDWE